jgi:hypothetical protein
MGNIGKPLPVKLLCSIIYGKEPFLKNVFKKLETDIGEIELVSDFFIFNHTNYYTCEMGEGLLRRFVIFKNLFQRDGIAKIKIITNNIEELFASNNKRQVNIDPGYISLENFILFTTKNYTHRIYLEQGIFADLTLIYEKRQFNTLPWTYPDYASLEIREFLKAVRENYRIEIKKEMQNENS